MSRRPLRDRLPARGALLAAIAAGSAALARAGGPAQDYALYCMGCHGAQAQGVPGRVPPLAGSLPRFMRTSAGRNYVLRVPGAANSALTDAQLTAVLNWLAGLDTAAGVEGVTPFAVDEVAAARRQPLANVQATRREVVRDLAASGAAPAANY